MRGYFMVDISSIDHWPLDYGHKLKYLAKHVAKLNWKKILKDFHGALGCVLSHPLVEFVDYLLCFKRFFPELSSFPISSKTIDKKNPIKNKKDCFS